MAPTIISRDDLRGLRISNDASITDVKHLASYNWLESKDPTIAVPGVPARWHGLHRERNIAKDQGLMYIAQNAARHPDSPLEPLFRSLLICEPTFTLDDIDIISDRNNIRKLLSFVEPSLDRHGAEDFTINVEAVHNAVIFQRTETATTEFVGPAQHKGFGHNFEKATTAYEIPGSTGHHRVCSYDFAGIKCIVRFETDAYLENSARTDSSDIKSTTDPAAESSGLSNLLDNMSLKDKEPVSTRPKPAHPNSRLQVSKQGRPVSPESVIEIKTRSAKNPLLVAQIAPQLWVSQTPKLVRAHHNRGLFYVPRVEDVRRELEQWERANQSALRNLAGLMEEIVRLARKEGAIVVRYDHLRDGLVVEKYEGKKVLPEDLYEKLRNGSLAQRK